MNIESACAEFANSIKIKYLVFVRLAVLALAAAIFVACKTPPDPIDHLVADFSKSYGLWENGFFPSLGLPQTAPPEQVIKKTFQMTGFNNGHVSDYEILKTRQVRIPGSSQDLYTAAMVRTDLGEKIVMFKYDGPHVGWWSRIYDANRTYYPNPS